jgi:hypothetical protein
MNLIKPQNFQTETENPPIANVLLGEGKLVRVTQLDGDMFNLACMQLISKHKELGDNVIFSKSEHKSMFEPNYDIVYASAIFTTTQPKLEIFLTNFPNAIVGGTWVFQNEEGVAKVKERFKKANILPLTFTVEKLFNQSEYSIVNYDYSLYPKQDYSVAFTQRGCTLACKFCSVGEKEGRNISLPYSIKHWLDLNPNNKNKLILQDNDFTNQPLFYQRCDELMELQTKVCINQGINVRLIDYKNRKMKDAVTNQITAPQARKLSELKMRDRKFKKRRIYTAWDNAKDEKIFWQGIETLTSNGFKPSEIMVYFLCNYWKKGLTDDVWLRFEKMREFGLMPYAMIYEKWNADKELKKFQEWVIQGRYHATTFEMFKKETKKQYLERKSNDGAQSRFAFA